MHSIHYIYTVMLAESVSVFVCFYCPACANVCACYYLCSCNIRTIKVL